VHGLPLAAITLDLGPEALEFPEGGPFVERLVFRAICHG
jgi:hypothetical protein